MHRLWTAARVWTRRPPPGSHCRSVRAPAQSCDHPRRNAPFTCWQFGPRIVPTMRVLVVSESFLPTVNGVTNSVCKVLDHLALRGHDAHVMVPACGAPATYAGFIVEEIVSV